MTARRIAAAAAALVLSAACHQSSTNADVAAANAAPNTLSSAERAAGWRLLFDGKTTQGWRGYRQKSMPDGWKAVDGALTRGVQL